MSNTLLLKLIFIFAFSGVLFETAYARAISSRKSAAVDNAKQDENLHIEDFEKLLGLSQSSNYYQQFSPHHSHLERRIFRAMRHLAISLDDENEEDALTLLRGPRRKRTNSERIYHQKIIHNKKQQIREKLLHFLFRNGRKPTREYKECVQRHWHLKDKVDLMCGKYKKN
ncbi:uncharacterized protein LOC143469844 isoform X2 [Clavelina lepadiformis]|uniref:uncharacterized protein LOC143469844 isoform X2 n=1 Tax=Clavelina lepadiformis TaxID=159417 RepID=UPI004042901E